MRFLAVATGGCLGALSRYGMGQWFAPFVRDTGFPWGTLVINLLGCFVLALFLTVTVELLVVNPYLRLGFSTGFLGAFTTFSTFTMESILLWQNGHIWYTAMYIFASVFLGIAMSSLGFIVTRGFAKIRAKQELSEADELVLEKRRG
ncbi:MAG TPA: fluoride efflux transporter CrcB [Methylomusa anaerophila]|uniref:Fluoride-specific ion channel FluC n=1 Tax=Methylomusa anaerophila TaxID=1930071 RepID=A0A348AM16_9FIRM|nr:fluoride efflux transporter CrcB [Methylomusa anaerophila]BBB92114.1 putative fluoride ion transporter CrcB [Methylomusa anaerophila]HML87872.1 fluoride efflux transporter CrcB [Methylomusa anaerophila]